MDITGGTNMRRGLLLVVLLYNGFAFVVPDQGSKGSTEFFGYNWWIILGKHQNSSLTNGLRVHTGINVDTSNDGPYGMTAWNFKGLHDSFVKVENNPDGPLAFDQSFTIGTYFYQDEIRNGPIVEWEGRPRDIFGTHFWIWERKLFINLGPTWIGSKSLHWHTLVPNGRWHFVGTSYNHNTGNITMWLDTLQNIYEYHVGTRTPTAVGDVYIGVRPKSRLFNPLRARLAGLTILQGSIRPSQIREFKRNIDAFLSEGSTAFFGYSWWMILGHDQNSPLTNGLKVHISNVDNSDDGPYGMTAWNFKGLYNSFVKVENLPIGSLAFDQSFTIGTYFYQDEIRNGPIVEWQGRPRDGFGTHFWIWERMLFTNLGPTWGGPNSLHWHTEVPPGRWHFIGVSYNHDTGNITMWLDTLHNVYEFHVGTRTLTADGYVYIGVRPKSLSFNPLKARLAGLTILQGPIHRSQIMEFKCNIEAFLSEGAAVTHVDYSHWSPNESPSFTTCFNRPDELPPIMYSLPTAIPKTFNCSETPIHPDLYSGQNWWILLGHDADNPNLHGLQLEVRGVQITSDGPNGIPAWNFYGSPNSYIRVPNPIGGHLDLQESFTIGTFIYQSERRNGALLEWRGSTRGNNFGAHFWVWNHVLFVNIVGKSFSFRPVPLNQWYFVGVTYSRSRKRISLWIDDGNVIADGHTNTWNLRASAFGDVYIGNRGSYHNFVPFKGKLAGLTVLDGYLANKSQINGFKCNILANVHGQ